VSAFRQGVNIQFDPPPQARVVSLQTQDAPLHPWSIEVPLHVQKAAIGTPCWTEPDQLRLGEDLALQWSPSTIRSLAIQPWKRVEMQHVHDNMQSVHHRLADLPQASSDWMDERVSTMVRSVNAVKTLPPLAEWIGSGGGSTPSGDDALLGMLAAWTACLGAHPACHDTLVGFRDAIHDIRLWERTTLASAQMLEAGASGSFPEPLCALTSSLKCKPGDSITLERAMDRVLELGASSGQFFLMGFAAILEQLTIG